MKRGFLVGIVLGGVAALALGIGLAMLPSTPTWTFWQIKRAVDRHDYDTLRELIDLKAVAANALHDVASDGPEVESVDLGAIARALMGGGKVVTIFNDPEHPVRITWREFVSAWWNMQRDGRTARLRFAPDGHQVMLLLGQRSDARWQVVGLTPLGALIRVKPPSEGKRSAEIGPRSGVDRGAPGSLATGPWRLASSAS